ncbi:MAG TPA: ABC-2 family transporter protein [Armatimonadota bacterium]|nr:ABC-2 family transporter protein [Armatimonadota bacterium]
MADNLRLYLHYVGISIRGQMQYRASFLMLTLAQLLITAMEFVAVWALFARFGNLRGWSLPEVALFYGIVNVAFALAEGIGRGFDTFAAMVKSGDFDRLLLRPRSTALQVAAQEWQLMRVGRLLQASAVLLWSMSSLPVEWSAPKLALLAGAILGGACLFYGLLVLQATLSFWTVESLEIWNAVTYGGVETAQYPLTIYRGWFRRFFTVVVPLACVNYFPAHALLGRVEPLGSSVVWQCAAPGVGVLFLIVALQVWKLGVRHYRSTGS